MYAQGQRRSWKGPAGEAGADACDGGGRRMFTTGADYDVKCMMCGVEVGQIVGGRLIRHAGCTASMPRKNGLARCCHCGGSLYLDPLDVYGARLQRADLSKVLAGEVA